MDILGNINNGINTNIINSVNSSILSGNNVEINNFNNTLALGCLNFTANTSNAVYVSRLIQTNNIKNTNISGGGLYYISSDDNAMVLYGSPSSAATIYLPNAGSNPNTLTSSDAGFKVTIQNRNTFSGNIFVQYDGTFDYWTLEPGGYITIYWDGTNYYIISGSLSPSSFSVYKSYGSLIGGDNNIINTGSSYSFVIGGFDNDNDGDNMNFIIGGDNNKILNGISGSTIINGKSITADTNNTVYVSNINISDSINLPHVNVLNNYSTDNNTIIGVSDTSIQRTITISSSDISSKGRVLVIKDESGLASINNIIINTESSETIDGQSSLTISDNYGVIRLYSNGSNLFVI